MDNQQVRLENLISIPETVNYFTDGKGNIFSNARGKLKMLKCHEHFGRSRNPYMRVKIKNRLWLAHRFIGACLIGRKLLPNEMINHINGITTDNSIINLEVVNHLENVKHAVKNNLYCHGDDWYRARDLK